MYTPTTHYALRSIEHNGVRVYYTVDFRKQQVSIVDHEGKPKSFVFDDRDQVVSMWREAGFRCLQVQEGNF